MQTDLHCLFVICGRTIKFTRCLESFTATIVSCGVPRVYLNRASVIRDCLINFPSRAVSEAAMIEGVGILRADLDCLSEICNRANVVALGLEGAAAAKVGVLVERIDLDRLAIICDRAVDFALGLVASGTIIIGFGKPRVDVDRLAEICDRALVFSFNLVGRNPKTASPAHYQSGARSRYPTPVSVRTYCGRSGSASIFCRSCRT